jgi:hypothetical protein
VLLTVLLAFVALRARRTASHVTIDDHGVVDIRSGETHHRFDVYDASTDLEMVGVPGQRGWEVRFKRRALPPVVVTAAMVDAEAFSRELAPGAVALAGRGGAPAPSRDPRVTGSRGCESW